MSYIAPDNTLVLVTIVLVLTWFGFWIDSSRIGKILPGVICIISLGALLSNLRITPFSAPAYDFIATYIVPAAIPLLMIKSDLYKIFLESGRVMIGFAIACIGIVIGVLIGYNLLNLGAIGPQVAGVYTGGFIGGSISMVAVARAVSMTASDLTTAIGASTLPSIMGLMVLVAIPSSKLIQKLIPSKIMEDSKSDGNLEVETLVVPSFRLTHITGALALTFSICLAAKGLAELVSHLSGHDQTQFYVLYVTAVTVTIANLFPRQLSKLSGDFELGMIFMYAFFAMVGFGTNAFSFLHNAVSLFYLAVIMLAVNFVFVLVMAKLFKLDLAEAVTGCGAAIVGPAATAAVVAGKGWRTMITPAIMTGIFCHIVGNFAGISLTALLR